MFELEFLLQTTGPDAQNLHNTAAWGRALVGSGVGLFSAGEIASWTPWKLLSGAGENLVKPIGAIMIAAGGLIGYVLPLLFAIYGLMGAITWLVTVASTFFGVTLWAAGMAAPKGEEHTSQLSAKGWNALIFIGLYPALAVGGLAAAVVVSAVGLSMVQMLAMGLWGMFDPGTAEIGRPLESIGGMLIGGAIIVLAVVLLSWNVVVTSAQLVTNFPRAVLNMISLSEPGLNPYENNMNGIMGGISMSGRQMLTGALSNAISRNASKAKNGLSPRGNGVRDEKE
jgi:conjugal transfer/type IV secretion protein DotA/TraY